MLSASATAYSRLGQIYWLPKDGPAMRRWGGFSGSDIFVSNCHFPALCDRDGPTSASSCLAGRETDPALGCAVLLDIEVFLPVEKYVYATFKFLCIIELAGRIGAKSVGRCRSGHPAPIKEVGWVECSRE